MFHKVTHRDPDRGWRLLDVDGSYDRSKVNSCFSSGHLRSSPDRTVPPMPIFPPLRYPHTTVLLDTSFLIPFTHTNLPPCDRCGYWWWPRLLIRKRLSGRPHYRQPAYLLTTDLTSSARQLLQSTPIAGRSSVNHREEKDTLGVGQAPIVKPHWLRVSPIFLQAVRVMATVEGVEACSTLAC